MPRPLYPCERNAVPIVQKIEWAAGPVWTYHKLSPPPTFEPRTVQAVASRYAGLVAVTLIVNLGCSNF